ncbi:hypothetical protein CPC08DRAFT_755553 [Agrocybe pediades]|nr:hypothetical protein CPC08DRAFT_755553 [Agrocybe pediades]
MLTKFRQPIPVHCLLLSPTMVEDKVTVGHKKVKSSDFSASAGVSSSPLILKRLDTILGLVRRLKDDQESLQKTVKKLSKSFNTFKTGTTASLNAIQASIKKNKVDDDDDDDDDDDEEEEEEEEKDKEEEEDSLV